MRLLLILLLAIPLIMPVFGQDIVDDVFYRGNTLSDQGKYDEAIREYDRVINFNPNIAEAWCNKGVALVNLGKYDAALNALNKAIEIDPQIAEAWNGKGTVLYAQGKYDEAILAYDKAIQIDSFSELAEPWYKKVTFSTLKASTMRLLKLIIRP